MKIFVCIKQVPDTETKIKFAADGKGIDPAGVKWVMNPYDEYAVEEALKLQAANAGATVTIASVGPKARAVDSIRTALAMGANDGVIVDAPADLDSYSTAKALAKAIEQAGGADIIFTGMLAIDDNQSAVSQMVAEFLNIPHTTVVSKFAHSGEKVVVEREAEGGTKEVVEMDCKSVVAANKGLNAPRYASLPGIMKAKSKPVKEFSLDTLGVIATDRKSSYANFQMPPDRPAVRKLAGEPAQQAAELVKLLREEAKVL